MNTVTWQMSHPVGSTRVSCETSFASKQPKLEPKPVLAQSETERLFRLFRILTKTVSFGVLIEPKQTKITMKMYCGIKNLW